MGLNELMLTKRMTRVSILSVITGTFLKYFAIASVKESFIEFTFCMSKDESIILLRNVDLTKKVAYYKI